MNLTLDRIQKRNDSHLKFLSDSPSDSFAVTLRKEKRQETIKKRRQTTGPSASISLSEIPLILSNLSKILQTSENCSEILEVLRAVRGLVSTSESPPIDLIMQSMITHDIFNTLNINYPDEIIRESSWIFCNLATGSNACIQCLIEIGSIEQAVGLIGKVSDEVMENIIWFIGNIAADCNSSCEDIINSQFILKMQEFYFTSTEIPQEVLEITAWTFSNLVRKSVDLPIDKSNSLLNILKNILPGVNTEKCLYNWVKAVCGISFKSPVHNQAIIERKLIKQILSIAEESKDSISAVALRILGNILSGTKIQTQILLNFGVLDTLMYKADSLSEDIRKEVFWALSNITGGTAAQIEIVIKHQILPLAIAGMNDINQFVRNEAIWVLTNIGLKGSPEHIIKIVDLGVLKYIRLCLVSSRSNILMNGVKLVTCVINAANMLRREEVLEEISKNGCIDALEHLSLMVKGPAGDLIEKALSSFYSH